MGPDIQDSNVNEETTCGYGSVEGYEYSVPITPLSEDYGWPGSSTSTIVSSESDNLLERCDLDTKISFQKEVSPKSFVDYFFEVLGFVSNPISDVDAISGIRNSSASDLRLSMLSNFSTAYNVISISLSMSVMEHIYEATAADKSLCSSALIAGMIVGQLAGGTLGDLLGRHRAMAAVMLLQIFAALASAVSFPISLQLPDMDITLSIFHVLAYWRFILGLGCGGVYPLAATLTAESSKSSKDRGKSVALTFSFQGVGYLVVPLFSWLVVTLFDGYYSLVWRLILGVGAVPGFALTMLRLHGLKRQPAKAKSVGTRGLGMAKASSLNVRAVPVSIIDAVLMEKHLFKKMMGTGGCWFLFDILFYGNTLFEPVVLSEAFGAAETIQKAARDTAIIAAMALPGYFVSVFAVGRQSPRFVQIHGFCAMGILYLIIGVLFDKLSEHRSMLLLVYGSTFFFSNYGPNASTFMLPSLTFSRACRSTLNGLCAACGKAGALIGAMVFATASHHFGQDTVFVTCALLAFVGAIITSFCVSERVGQDDDEGEVALDTPDTGKLASFNERLGEVPMKIVYSEPSLIDYQ